VGLSAKTDTLAASRLCGLCASFSGALSGAGEGAGCWRPHGKEISRLSGPGATDPGQGCVVRVCVVGGLRDPAMATTAMRLVRASGSNPGLSSFLGQPGAGGLNAVGVGGARTQHDDRLSGTKLTFREGQWGGPVKWTWKSGFGR